MSTLKIFISYSHDSPEHQERVLVISDRLRTDGFDCNIDQYEVSPNEGWPRWMARQIREADFVLVVCTDTYFRRFNGDEKPGVGQGVRWESMLSIQDLYDKDSLNEKFVPVFFESTDSRFIPTPLGGATYVLLDGDSGYERLLRRLLNIPPAERPPLGEGASVQPRQRQGEFFTARPEVELSLARLPSTGSELFGRDGELAALDEAWEDGETNVVTLVAFGGVGKSALVNGWLGRMRKDGYRGARRVYGWSFYSQGISDDRQASGDEFLSAALRWFGIEEKDIPKSAWDRGERLAQLCRENRTLLILDGLEPLQHPPGEQIGKLRDPGVQSLLRELAVDNPGLCVVSTRIVVDDLKGDVGTSVRRIDLDVLSPEAGGRFLASLGVKGPADELEQAARDFGGHALALSLLGTYLSVVYDGDVRKRNELPPLTIAAKDGGHAKRVMEGYEQWFAGKPEQSVLRMLGLFDRPAEAGAIKALRGDKPIEYLTDTLTGISEADWKFVLKNLRDVRLLAKADPGALDTLDCHPHVREHFGAKLEQDHGVAWRAGHDRLFEYFRGPGCKKGVARHDSGDGPAIRRRSPRLPGW